MYPSFSTLAAVLVTITSTCQAQSITATPASSSSGPAASGSGGPEPCAAVSSISASIVAASSATPTAIRVPAGVAWACLNSVPIIKDDALNLVDGITAFLGVQSDLSFLKDPPSGYLLPGIDLIGSMQSIREKVSSDAYQSELEFQVDVNDVLVGAHDGHLSYALDLLSVFTFIRRQLGSLVSVADDYSSGLPKIYRISDLLNGTTAQSIDKIDGVDASEWVVKWSMTDTLQDPDALYNDAFWELAQVASSGGDNGGTVLGISRFYTEETINITFKNGFTQTFSNVAIVNNDFTDVDSGDAFYSKFCSQPITPSTTAPSSSTTTTPPEEPTTSIPDATSSTANPRGTRYPTPVVQETTGSVAGYFLNGSFSDVAVLSLNAFLQATDGDPVEAQSVISEFLAQCTESGKTKLIIDLSANGGGNVFLGYDLFKQLFPQLEPYGASTIRASPETDALGQIVTPLVTRARANNANDTTLASVGAGSPYDATAVIQVNGDDFPSWAALFGPNQIHGDKYTNQQRLKFFDTPSTLDGGSIVVSGYGNRTDIPPQPFKSENIILFTDGYCASTCTIFSHFMKYQGKVRSVVAGGRPQAGPMQAVGGVKGSEVGMFSRVYGAAVGVILQGSDVGITADQIAKANQTDLRTIVELGGYVSSRSPSWGKASYNLRNNIAEGDTSVTPTQFVYEAADCRIWWTRDMLLSATNIWNIVAKVTWQDDFKSCIAGSTGQPSSLSGNSTLKGNGQPSNVTGSLLPPTTTSTGGGAQPSHFRGAADTVRTQWMGSFTGLMLAFAFLFALA